MKVGADEFSFRVLSSAHLVELFALHKEVVSALPESGFLSVRAKVWFEEVIEEKGFVLGAFQEGRLCAYTTIITPTEPWSELARPLEELGVGRSVVARSAGTAVRQDFRGRGILKRIDRLARGIAEARAMKYTFGALFPQNVNSFKVRLQNGYWVIGVHIDEDGDNLLILRPTRHFLAEIPPGRGVVAIDDIATQLEHLKDGTHVGAPVKIGSAYALRFVPWSTFRTILATAPENKRRHQQPV